MWVEVFPKMKSLTSRVTMNLGFCSQKYCRKKKQVMHEQKQLVTINFGFNHQNWIFSGLIQNKHATANTIVTPLDVTIHRFLHRFLQDDEVKTPSPLW
jgi:hypothetical protein